MEHDIRLITEAPRSYVDDLEFPEYCYPDYEKPIARIGSDGVRELVKMRWGWPARQPGMPVITNVRNTSSGFWKRWLAPEYRCLVPSTAFCEWTDNKPKVQHWFALNNNQPPFCFAGIRRPWTGARGPKKAPIEGDHLVYSFLTTDASAVVGPIHSKAMPVIPRTPEEMTGSTCRSTIEHAAAAA
jgi:putative SOS response-associated peptidase YedK